MAAEIVLQPAENLSVRFELGDDDSAPAWTVEGQPSGLLRVVAGRAGERVLVLAAARAARAQGHDEEGVIAVLLEPDKDPTVIEDPLLSMEYAADGSVRRIGLELYPEGEDYPIRGAGVVTGEGALDFRLDGDRGAGAFEVRG